MIHVHRRMVVENEHLYGPGRRLLLFLQGCSIHCDGCVNRHIWTFEGGEEMTPETVVTVLLDEKLEGVTLHGGEPLDQADGLLPVVKAVKEAGKTIILFTGYNKKELNATQRKVWDAADLVVAGRFVMAKRNVNLQFRGSTNQRVYAHKGPYAHYRVQDGKTSAMITIDSNGEMEINGFFTDDIAALAKNG